MRVITNQPEPPKPLVTLEMGWDEAEKLRDTLGLISRTDYANLTYRKDMPEGYAEFMDSIYDVLEPVLHA